MNTGDKETAATKTVASVENQVPPGAAEETDKDEVTAPDKEEVLTRRATVPASGEVEATTNGTGEKQQEQSVGDSTKTSEQGAAGADSAEAQAARRLQFQQKKKEMQLAYEEHQRQAAALFKSQEQAIVDQPEQAAAAAAAAVQAAAGK